MTEPRHPSILNYLRQLLGAPASGIADAELLRRFVTERDEAAFELLLWRHAAMVLHVCRQVLRDEQSAEDAFQATFLVLVRKAGSISRHESLGSWLYRVAHRIALKASAQKQKRMSGERESERLDSVIATTDADNAEEREQRRIIAEEVQRLPAKFRAAIVACYFEGKSLEEAGHQLGWPRGTVASRLSRARDVLRRRLVRRGIAPTAAILAATCPPSTSAVVTQLIHFTLQTAKQFAASAATPSRAVALAEGVLQAMYWSKIKIAAIILLVAGLGGAGASFWAAPPKTPESPNRTDAATPKAAADAKKFDDGQTIARNKALSRLNLKKLAFAMHRYANANKFYLPPPAIYDKDGKALLSWRVALLPYLDQNNLYKLFHLDEPWDSDHNKKLLSKMPQVYAPLGVKTRQPFSTFYQVFVSPQSSVMPAAFMQGQQARLPNSFPDGTENTILIVEAGKAVPWTKPEDLPYEGDKPPYEAGKPLPELGGLFADVFHAVYANGDVHTLTKKYDEFLLRTAIVANDGLVAHFENLEARSADVVWRRKNRELEKVLEPQRESLRLLREERDALQKRPPEKRSSDADTHGEKAKKEMARLRKELDEVKKEIAALNDELRRKAGQKQSP